MKKYILMISITKAFMISIITIFLSEIFLIFVDYLKYFLKGIFLWVFTIDNPGMNIYNSLNTFIPPIFQSKLVCLYIVAIFVISIILYTYSNNKIKKNNNIVDNENYQKISKLSNFLYVILFVITILSYFVFFHLVPKNQKDKYNEELLITEQLSKGIIGGTKSHKSIIKYDNRTITFENEYMGYSVDTVDFYGLGDSSGYINDVDNIIIEEGIKHIYDFQIRNNVNIYIPTTIETIYFPRGPVINYHMVIEGNEYVVNQEYFEKMYFIYKNMETKINIISCFKDAYYLEQKEKNNINSESTFMEPQVKELTDSNDIKDINNKAILLLTNGNNSKKNDSELIWSTDCSNNSLVDLTDAEKLEIVLNHNYYSGNFKRLTKTEVNTKVSGIYKEYIATKMTEESFVNSFKIQPSIIEENIINDDYVKLFNLPSSKFPDKIINKIPYYYYDNETNFYMSSLSRIDENETTDNINNNCSDVIFYVYGYVTKGNSVYVKIAALTISKDGRVYKDIKVNESKYLYTGFSSNSESKFLKINPEKYDLYTLVFEKNIDGSYYYSSTNKIN